MQPDIGIQVIKEPLCNQSHAFVSLAQQSCMQPDWKTGNIQFPTPICLQQKQQLCSALSLCIVLAPQHDIS
jgi:hypothetical protein